MSTFLNRRWPVLALGLAGVLLHCRELLGGRPYFRDIHQLHVPAKMFLAQMLKSGTLPQWWPFDGGGSPLIPQPMFCVFHPTTLLYLILPFWSAYNATSLCATWLALGGTYLLARTLSLPRPAAVIAAGLFGLSGYVTCLGENHFSALAAGTMPWYLAALLVADRRRGAWLVIPGAVMALLLVAVDPQIAILSAGAGLVLTMIRSRRPRRAIILAVVSPLCGAALAAIQLLPSLAVVPDTERAFSMTRERWALPPSELLGFLAPENYGLGAWVRSTLFGWAGIGGVLASFAGMKVRRRRPILLVLLSLTFVSVWLALGNGYGLNRAAQMLVPMWSQLRYPMKSIVVAYLMLAVLAGYGFAHLASFRLHRMAIPLAIGAIPLGAAAVAMTTGLHPESATLAACLVGAVGCYALGRPRLAACVVLGQCTALVLPLMVTAPDSFYAPSPIVQVLQDAGVGLTGPAFERPGISALDSVQPELTAHASGGGFGTAFGALFGLPSLIPALPASSWRVFRLFDERHRDAVNGRLLGVYGVGYAVMHEPILDRLGKQALLRHGELDYAVVALRGTLGRAYITNRARVVPDGDEAIEAVTSADFAPGREIIVEDQDPHQDWTDRPIQRPVPAQVEPRGSPNAVRLQANLSTPGFVVLNEAYFHGWSATLDGQPVPILVANGLMRAVEAPAGEHAVEFQFHTPGLVAGAIVSLVAWFALVVALTLLRRRHSVS